MYALCYKQALFVFFCCALVSSIFCSNLSEIEQWALNSNDKWHSLKYILEKGHKNHGNLIGLEILQGKIANNKALNFALFLERVYHPDFDERWLKKKLSNPGMFMLSLAFGKIMS